MVGNLVYDTNELIQVVPNLKLSQNFLLDNFFPNIEVADTEFVSIDIDIGKRRMAPFCSPLVEGRLVETRRYQTNTFKPPYIKDKRAPDLRKPIRRMIGERIGGDMNAAARYAANVAYEMADQIDILNRRMEWMAAQALTLGTVTVAGDGFPTTLIDYGRSPLLTVGLAGAALWSVANVTAGTATPAANLEGWQRLILKESGAQVTDIIMTTTPYEAFLADPLVHGAVFYPALGQSGNVLNPGAQIQKGAILKGHWGSYRVWIYNDWYVDINNVEVPMIPDGTIIMTGPELMGIRAYAQIVDPKFNYASLPYAPKMWLNEDPAQLMMMMQSAPLVIPARVNASFSAAVSTPVFT